MDLFILIGGLLVVFLAMVYGYDLGRRHAFEEEIPWLRKDLSFDWEVESRTVDVGDVLESPIRVVRGVGVDGCENETKDGET